MPTKQEYSLMAAAVYNDARGIFNKVDVAPLGWVTIASQSDTTGGVLSSGLSINAYKKGSEIVIACKGTDFLVGTNNGQTASDLIADLALGGSLGFSSSQLFAASLFYQQVKEANPGATITFTGHSLGAGLASILAVWFNRPATIFADAPFELTALNATIWGLVGSRLLLSGYADPEFGSFFASYFAREAQVTGYYVEGEVLNKWLGLLPFVVGSNIPIRIGGGDQLPSIGGPLTLHSIVLHSAFQLSELVGDQLRKDTLVLPTLLARIFDDRLYAFKLESKDADFLTKLLQSQIPLLGGDMASGKLIHFADDMNKLGINVAGLSKAAQDALIAQGIEWYYWQNTDQQFFTQTGALLQYTTAQGAALPGAQNKAGRYVSAWLDPIAQTDRGYSVGYKFHQWNVVAGTAGATASALDVAKTQIFVGNSRDALCLTNNYKYPPNGGWARRLDLLNLPAASKQGRHVFNEFNNTNKFAPACWRTRRLCVPARLRARGLGACATRPSSRQYLGLHADSVATANGLRRSGTATRHVCGLGSWAGENSQNRNVHSVRVTGLKEPERRMNTLFFPELSTATRSEAVQ